MDRVSPVARLSALYVEIAGAQRRHEDVNLSDFLRSLGTLDDDALAEVIEADGRLRLQRARTVTLERYLNAVPDLLHRNGPLDAALDVTLRSLSRSGPADAASIEALIHQYPNLESAIREAGELNNALWSTNGLQQRIEGPQRPLPQDFGPLIPLASGSGEVERVPRYCLEKFLGQGAFGQVFLAVDRQLSEAGHPARVALKVLSTSGFGGRPGGSKSARERLAEEATKARRVDHPNVVRVLDRGVSAEDEDFIVYELVEGGDLGKRLQNRHEDRVEGDGERTGAGAQSACLAPREAAKMAAKIARGVQAAHAAGLIHCDLKPGNIMLTADGEPKVADFGIAIRLGEGGRRTSAADDGAGAAPLFQTHPIGNLAFISPEQYRMDDGALTIPSDVYAIGGILFLLLTGQLPNGSTAEAIAAAHHPETGRGEAPLIRPLRPGIDRDLESICRRAMAPKPQDRYSSAGALADDLEAWLRSEPLYWTRPSFLHVARLWMVRKPAVAAITALFVVSLIVGAGATTHYARKAEREAAEKEIASIRAEEAAQRGRIVQEQVVKLIERTQEMRQNRSTQVFPMIWTLEYLLGPDVLGTPIAIGETARKRLEAVETLVKHAEAVGTQNDLEALMWRTLLGFWLISNSEPDRAMTVLRSVRQVWGERLPAEDRWLYRVDAIIACARVRSLRPRASELHQNEAEELRVAEQIIAAEERRLAQEDSGCAEHYMMLETLMMLYAPDWQHEPVKLAAAKAEFDRLTTSSRAARRETPPK